MKTSVARGFNVSQKGNSQKGRVMQLKTEGQESSGAVVARASLKLGNDLLTDQVDGLVPVGAEGRSDIDNIEAVWFRRAQHFIDAGNAFSRGTGDDCADLGQQIIADKLDHVVNAL